MELSDYRLETLHEDGEFILYRGRHRSRIDAILPTVLAVAPVGERPAPGSLRRLEHEYALRAELDSGWAVRPLTLAPHQGRTMLVLEDPGGEALDRLLGGPMDVRTFLRLASGIATALAKVHQRGFIHKDLKPAYILVNGVSGEVRFTASDPMALVHCHIARRPVPPAERLPGLPLAISAIVMKLLAKTTEDRYQTTAGVAADLR